MCFTISFKPRNLNLLKGIKGNQDSKLEEKAEDEAEEEEENKNINSNNMIYKNAFRHTKKYKEESANKSNLKFRSCLPSITESIIEDEDTIASF